MRKRNYAHCKGIGRIEDNMVEDIEILSSHRRCHTCVETTPQAQVHNLVGTAKIDTSCSALNLRTVSRLIPNCRFDKQKFAAITIRIRNPMCTVLLFTSGKMVLTGCRTYLECIMASHEVVSMLRRSVPGTRFLLKHVSIQNIVGNVDLRLRDSVIDLERIQQENGIFCTYQKNMFPGLIYRPNECPVVLLIFISGKIVITGGKSTRDVKDGWSALWPFVRRYITPARSLT